MKKNLKSIVFYMQPYFLLKNVYTKVMFPIIVYIYFLNCFFLVFTGRKAVFRATCNLAIIQNLAYIINNLDPVNEL